jgi:hypothetical protein
MHEATSISISVSNPYLKLRAPAMGCLFSLQQSHIGEDERRERERERA